MQLLMPVLPALRMTILKLQISVLVLLLLCFPSAAQLRTEAPAQPAYSLFVHGVDRSTAFVDSLGIPSVFASQKECMEYINGLPRYLRAKGYINASVDTIQYDAVSARIILYVGDKYRWAFLDTKAIDPAILQAAGWKEKIVTGQPMDFLQVEQWQESILGYMENNGHPFARVYLDSLQITGEAVSARLRLEKGPLYTIDSIRVFGDARISNAFLQRYLDIRNGAVFSKEKLLGITRRIKQLPYVEEEYPARLVWLNTGAVLEMYLKPKKSSQVDVLVGFLPNNDQLSSRKLLITGQANLYLQNALGAGETIGLNWQQLQVRSPRLNLLYRHPYLFGGSTGLDFSFNMFRKDSTFLNVNFRLGAQYNAGVSQSFTLFLQRFQTIVNGVDKEFVLQYYRLPDEADISSTSAGLDYTFNNTNYRLNPSRGYEWHLLTTIGTKRIKRNNEVLALKDPGNPSFDFGSLYDTLSLKTYQLSVQVSAARYFPLGKQGRSTIKAAIHGGFLQSGSLFRNELFQVGGYKLLRGFDEESQYLSQYIIATAEYRYLIGTNSYFYVFSDGGWGKNNSRNAGLGYSYISAGLGLAFETKAGIFNLAWAAGKRNDLDFTLRQSKIHFGFAAYF